MIQQIEYRTGQLDYQGQAWTWVSGESAVAHEVASYSGKVRLRPLYDGQVKLEEYLSGKARLRG